MTHLDSSGRTTVPRAMAAGAMDGAGLSRETPRGTWPADPAPWPRAAGGGPSRPRHVRRLSVRLMLVAALAAAPVAGFALWHGAEARREVVSRVADDDLGLARALAAQHRLAVEDARRALHALADDPAAMGTVGICAGAAGGGSARPSMLAAVTRFSADLLPLCSGATFAQAEPLRAAAEATRAGGQVATGPVLAASAEADGRPLVPLAHPAADGGVVAALLDPAWLSPRLTALLPSDDALVVVTDGAGRVVATVPHRPDLSGTGVGTATAEAGAAGPPSARLGGQAMLISQAPLDGGLVIGIARDRAAVTADADAALLRTTGGIAIALLAGLLLAWLTARAMIGRPVQRIAAATGALLAGGAPSRLGPPYAGTAELAGVERALDALTDRLSRHEAALISSETQLSVKRQSEERFRALVELAPEAIVVEARGTVLYANSRAVDLFGAESMEELLAVPLIDRVHPDDREECRLRLRDAGTDGAVGVAEVRLRRFGGGDLVAEVVVGPIAYGGRPATHIMIRDVTDSRLARRRLRESEERFRALVESSPDLILAHDRGRIVLANARAAQVLFGETYGESVIGRSIFDIVDEADRAAAITRMQQFGQDPRPLPAVEMALKRADGGRMICEVVTAPVTFEGRLCLHTVLRDVTARRAEQASVAQSAKLATLGELAAGMAHELAQPMNIIRMAAEAALLGLDKGGTGAAAIDTEGPAAGRERLEMIAAQAGRMGEIIDHMRVFTRRDTGPEERFDAAEAARAALGMIDHGLRGDGVAVEVDLPDAGAACVRGRPVQLEQVVLNLLTNARDAVMERLESGTAPETWRPAVRVSGAVEAEAVVLRVEDTGIGVPEHLRDRLFDPFVTSKEAGIGTGLGLSISDGLIRAMGGCIGLDPAPAGGGAVFTVTLPRDTSATEPCDCGPLRAAVTPAFAPSASAAPQPAAQGGAAAGADEDDDEESSALVAHVLVADDEKEAATLMADYLRARGHRVSVAHDGLTATDIFMDDPADVLVTDMRMPGCDGRNLIANLRKHVPDLPVVVVTGHIGAREARGLETDDQVAAVLRKPASLQRVADLVDTLFAATA